MKPEAIISAAEELLQAIDATDQPAGEVINHYTRSRRYIGSKDRRHLTDLVWTYIRHQKRFEYLYPTKPLSDILSGIYNAALPLPTHIPDAPDSVNFEMPDWLIPLIPNTEAELSALLEPAPVVLRAVKDRDTVRQHLMAEGIETTPTPRSPFGLFLTKRTNIQGTTAFRNGLIEVQDEGSQCLALATGIHPNDTVLDYCAGAGGKSLIFAQMMKNQGLIVAHDISERSLQELKRRASRAQATCIQVQKPLKSALYTHVVVDAPCSGTGTWRRFPDRRWKLTQEQFQTLLQKQADILDKAVSFVALNGYLSYMTCSLTTAENANQAQAFLTRHPDFVLIKEQAFTPATTQTDGFYLAQFQKIR